MKLKKYKRDKKEKIQRIIHSTKILVEEKGYSTVSIRDIAEKADVSIGLIYKYFPKGKFQILKQLSSKNINEEFMMMQPDEIDFSDFPGYIREVNKNLLELHEKNAKLIKAVTIAALMEEEVLEDIKSTNTEDYVAICEFFNKFKGVDIPDENSVNVLTEWSLAIKSLIFYSTMFQTIFKDEKSLLDMLVELSLKIWNYNP